MHWRHATQSVCHVVPTRAKGRSTENGGSRPVWEDLKGGEKRQPDDSEAWAPHLYSSHGESFPQLPELVPVSLSKHQGGRGELGGLGDRCRWGSHYISLADGFTGFHGRIDEENRIAEKQYQVVWDLGG
jgi:hypothetical protein